MILIALTGGALRAGAAAGFFASFFGLRGSLPAFIAPLAMIRSSACGQPSETREAPDRKWLRMVGAGFGDFDQFARHGADSESSD
ncbi:hypothetical protein [Mesorhizobium sp.]|uniref:hypothetical protein n=1 Tax=Mesorhizobium sp. TaxID=1871066 RepID=UPI001649F315|nr:hypothetical protein [Mesorhizobium sp.]